MTRENLLAIIDKFQLFPDQRNLMSVTQLVDLMKKKTSIAVLNQLTFAKRTDNPTIVFTVGFEDSDPAVASRVANELVTRILNEDLRDRTNRATDTTKFLSREMQRLQAENAAIEAKIAQVKETQLAPASTGGNDQLAQLKADYAQKSAVYSEKHPLMQALEATDRRNGKIRPAPAVAPGGVGLEGLQSQQEAIQKNLDTASAKYAAAQLGEALEKNQQSEKLEVIEQPTVPQEPIKPNRPKIMALSVLLALAAGAGLTLLLEMLDTTIRRSTDIYGIVDSQIGWCQFRTLPPGMKSFGASGGCGCQSSHAVPALAIAIALIYFLTPPLDLIIAKARVGLFR